MNDLRKYLASIGRKGGKATGKVKVRGSSAYYKRLARKASAARKRRCNNRPGSLKE